MITYLIPPSPLDLYEKGTPKLTCLVVDLESDENVTVTWTQEHKKPAGSASQKTIKHYNATTSIASILPVDAKDWIEGEGYRCIVAHPDFPKPIVRSITKAPGEYRSGELASPSSCSENMVNSCLPTGKRSAPEVYVFPPPEEESKDKRTLTCLIQNFFPEDIFVQWLQDNEPLPDTQHSTTAPLKSNGSNQGFFVFSRLEVTKTHWTQRKKFTCRVIHEAIRERTISKSLGNASFHPSQASM